MGEAAERVDAKAKVGRPERSGNGMTCSTGLDVGEGGELKRVHKSHLCILCDILKALG